MRFQEELVALPPRVRNHLVAQRLSMHKVHWLILKKYINNLSPDDDQDLDQLAVAVDMCMQTIQKHLRHPVGDQRSPQLLLSLLVL
eukprot:766842-Hanusia_phi.AAC.2